MWYSKAHFDSFMLLASVLSEQEQQNCIDYDSGRLKNLEVSFEWLITRPQPIT